MIGIRYRGQLYRKADDTVLYFAYGSNLSQQQIKKRTPSAKFIAKVELKDFRLAFTGNSKTWGGAVATVVPSPGSVVEGVVYSMSKDDIEAMDGYEGHPTIYKRVTKKIKVNGESKEVYVYTRPVKGSNPVSPTYLVALWKAYKVLGFDHQRLIDAVADGS